VKGEKKGGEGDGEEEMNREAVLRADGRCRLVELPRKRTVMHGKSSVWVLFGPKSGAAARGPRLIRMYLRTRRALGNHEVSMRHIHVT
jgi:hypothetical protein